MSHSVIKISSNLNSIVSSNKKKIGFFFGAGSSMNLGEDLKEYNIPGIKEMTNNIVESIPLEYEETIKSIKECEDNLFNIESLLTNINMRIEVIGKGVIDSLNKEKLVEFKKYIVENLKKILLKHTGISNHHKENLLPHVMFAKWLKNTKRDYGVEIFTSNYDFLFEMAMENQKVRYFDGFFGSFQPFFDSTYFNNTSKDGTVKLWKVHGSLGWMESENGIVRSLSDNHLMILPSILKYKDSRKEPYTSLLDRLSYFIKSDDCVLITSGYSFKDQHINEIILDALKTNSNSLVIGLLYDKQSNGKTLLEEDLTFKKICTENTRLWILGQKYAYIDGRFGKYEYENVSKENMDYTENIFEADYIEIDPSTPQVKPDKDLNATLKIVDSLELFRYLESLRLEKNHD